MNDPRDSKMDELFSRLRQIEPPIETKFANREAVAAELEKLAAVDPAKPIAFWKRSVSIPIPVVAASALLMLTFAAFSLRTDGQPAKIVDRDDQTVNDDVANPSNDGEKNGDTESLRQPQRPESSSAQLAYHESSVYLCGIGPLRTESRYVFEE